MASLRDTVKQYQEELRDGIAWIAFWREGRSWNGDYFYLEANDALTAEDKSHLEEIRQKDPAAVMLNSYYCGYLGEDMTVDELTAGVRRHYENGYNSVADFIEAHDDTRYHRKYWRKHGKPPMPQDFHSMRNPMTEKILTRMYMTDT